MNENEIKLKIPILRDTSNILNAQEPTCLQWLLPWMAQLRVIPPDGQGAWGTYPHHGPWLADGFRDH